MKKGSVLKLADVNLRADPNIYYRTFTFKIPFFVL